MQMIGDCADGSFELISWGNKGNLTPLQKGVKRVLVRQIISTGQLSCRVTFTDRIDKNLLTNLSSADMAEILRV